MPKGVKKTVASPWISVRGGETMSGLGRNLLLKLAATGRIRTLAEPGCPMKLRAEDVERIVAERRAM